MSEERRRILDLLSQGKVTVDEAEKLLNAVGGTSSSQQGSGAGAKKPPKFLRVLVDGVEGGKPMKVDVRVPIALIRAGVKFSSLIPKDAQSRVNAALGEKGMSFDLSSLNPEALDQLVEGLSDLNVNVDAVEEGETAKVRVFCE